MFSLNLLGFYRVLVSANKKEPFSGYHLLFFYDFFADFMEFNSFLGQCCVGRVLSQSYWVLLSLLCYFHRILIDVGQVLNRGYWVLPN